VTVTLKALLNVVLNSSESAVRARGGLRCMLRFYVLDCNFFYETKQDVCIFICAFVSACHFLHSIMFQIVPKA
jgi:hypothetical protein